MAETFAETVKRVSAEMEAERKAYNPDNVKVGDLIKFWHRPYQHNAHVQVTKVNRATFDATEIKGSYRQGTHWRIHKRTEGLSVSSGLGWEETI